MRILLTGATGFVGTRLREVLGERGHQVRCAGRRRPPACHDWFAVDLAQARSPGHWRAALDGVDAVVNAAGIFRERGKQTFAVVHDEAPRALFDACVQAGVPRVLQVSALGASQQLTPFQRSKHAADEHLLRLPLDAVVAQPSLLFAEGGTSASAFLAWASLPLQPLPGRGRQQLQPMHLDDATQALCALLERLEAEPQRWRGRRVALVGPHPLWLRDYLRRLRAGLRLPPAWQVPLAPALVTLAARAGDHLPHSLLDSASWRMLRAGNVGDPGSVTALLRRAPRPVEAFIAPSQAPALRTQVQLAWLLPLLRLSLALVWIVTGIVSLGVYPVQESHALLGRTGVPPAWQPLMLAGAAGLDLLLGALTLRPPRRWSARRMLWGSQAALMLFYMGVIAIKLPEFWIHPYGPLLKNLPMLAILVVLLTLDRGTPRNGD